MSGRIVIGCYRPKPGKEDAFLRLLKGEAGLLRREGFLTDYPITILRSPADGAWIQIAQWSADDAADRAHENQAVLAHWAELAETAEYLSMADLQVGNQEFPEFEYLPNFFDAERA